MTEIRPIRPEEAEDFLILLCGVFELDPDRARAVFFSEPFFDLSRKWALIEGGKMLSILTVTPLEFGFGQALGIAGVATCTEERSKGLASCLLSRVLEVAEQEGEGVALLFAHREEMYAKAGFTTIDHVIRGQIKSCSKLEYGEDLSFEQTCALYTQWSGEAQNRLRRNERRWRYWKWQLRTVERAGKGYVCSEGNLCKEAILHEPTSCLHLPPDTQWYGLERLTQQLGIPLEGPRQELYVMGWNFPGHPEMFMTDQF